MKIIEGAVTAPQGFLAAGVTAQIKNKSKKDLAIIFSERVCNAAGVFTTNVVKAHCIGINQEHLADKKAQAIVVNSGNANACNGEQGLEDTINMASLTADLLDLKTSDVLVASTGVIGVNLPMGKVNQGIKEAVKVLSLEGSSDAAQAILTTDLVTKEIAVEVNIAGKAVRVGAIAKGSGMIDPNMATMLAFITTDANISQDCLAQILQDSVEVSYNMISVDGDTSTNDMALVLANGLADNELISQVGTDDYRILQEAFVFVNTYLAKMIAKDGEGATRLIEVIVKNADRQKEARKIALSIVSSSLTKTAIYGQDANWGRILAAAGYAGVEFNPALVDIYLGQVMVAQNGSGLEFDEIKAKGELQKDQVIITVDLKLGREKASAWGCDLTPAYIDINASYRT